MNFCCRHCSSSLNDIVIDLGHQPLSNNYLSIENLSKEEIFYPLKVYVCKKCWLVQLPQYLEAKEIFRKDYAYFSSTSVSWCAHAEDFVNKSIRKLNLNKKSFVVEIASNDGYLLQYFKKLKVPILGIEPTFDTAQAAIKKNIPTLNEFFNSKLADEIRHSHLPLKGADLVIANNVLAHVPDINDFMKGMRLILSDEGIISIEFPHLFNLIKNNQFDTIYHEHFSYLSLLTLQIIAEKVGLEVIEVDEIQTHGGSLRVYLSHKNKFQPSKNVKNLILKEKEYKLNDLHVFLNFQKSAIQAKNSLLSFLINQKSQKKELMAYGAAAKGNTLLNYAGIKSDLIPMVADLSKSKQGKFLPGSHIPIVSPDEILSKGPDQLLVLPWNLIGEIRKQLFNVPRLITAIPKLTFFD